MFSDRSRLVVGVSIVDESLPAGFAHRSVSIDPGWLAAFAIFVAVSAPSLKLFIPGGELLNVLPLVLIAPLLVWTVRRNIHVSEVAILLGYLLFFFLLTFSVFFGAPGLSELTAAFKYVAIVAISLLIALASDARSVRQGLRLILLWGLAIALVQLTVGVPIGDRQHYLTVGLPIGASLCLSLSGLVGRPRFVDGIWFLAAAAICFVSLSTLFGRGPMFFPLIVFLLCMFLRAIFASTALVRLRYALVVLGFIGAAIVSYRALPLFIRERLARAVLTPEEEPRFQSIYIPAWRAIVDRPFGYGLEGAERIVGYYPHNIFLEIAISSGVVGLAAFGILLYVFLRSCVGFLVRQPLREEYRGIAFLSLYFFLVWNVSFPISSAYGLFTLMLVQSLLYLRMKYVVVGVRGDSNA